MNLYALRPRNRQVFLQKPFEMEHCGGFGIGKRVGNRIADRIAARQIGNNHASVALIGVLEQHSEIVNHRFLSRICGIGKVQTQRRGFIVNYNQLKTK